MAFPFARQQAMAASRAVRPEDSVSNVSWGSWQQVQTPVQDHDDDDDDLPPADLELPTVREVDLDNKVSAETRSQADKPDQAEHPGASSSSHNKQPAQPDQTPTAPAQSKAPPPPPPTGGPVQGSSTAAPATQAAQNLVAGVNLQYGSRKLRKQQERAARKGARALRFGQMGGVHNALRTSLPAILEAGRFWRGGALSACGGHS